MCGIVGVFGNVLENDKKVFRDMLLMDVVRGQDSTGVLHIPCSASSLPKIHKDLGHPANLWDPYTVELENLNAFSDRGVFKASTKGLLGHNRAATMGKVNVSSAHPFRFGDVYGVHNGTLYSTYSLEGDHEVDSMCIYDTIDKKGIDHTWKNIYGAAALVWWDDKEGLLNICRNKERTLFFRFNEKKDVLYIASEPWMIVAAMSRNSVKPALDGEGKIIAPTLFPDNRLYQFKIRMAGIDLVEDRELKKWSVPDTGTSSTTGFQGTKTPETTKNSTNGVKSTSSNSNGPSEKPTAPSKLINSGWAGGLPKLDKENRDMIVTIRFPLTAWSQSDGEWKFYFIARGPKGEKVLLFPSRLGGFTQWDAAYKNAAAEGKSLRVRINCRPRIDGVLNTDNATIRVSSDKMVLVDKVDNVEQKNWKEQVPEPLKAKEVTLYPIYSGFKVPESDFYKALRIAGDACCNCGTVLDHQDANEIGWLGKFHVACKDCKDDPSLQNVVGGIC